MNKTAFILLFTGALFSFATRSAAQGKTGCVSMSEVIDAMPETKKADSTLAKYKTELEQQFQAYQAEYSEQARFLSSADTAKYTKPILNLKRQSLAQLLGKLQGYDQEAGALFNQKRTALLQPIQKKAEDAIQQVSKENGFAFVFEKEGLHVYPPSADILPLVKKKLGLL
ncbi:MAG TPA: OmpH family outer membrane protein [Puia sp.]|uniref:OmpH family outer membrane protein n=1 Tax=Puia sp. TaxID=2045100 RepID=UPI002C4A3684|nr:OmpH family outer membrane protein [Puia sp.]HVU96931.1 OmpH family outer membrane protein [Puia sp.]